jgi:hypothetical protein
MKAAPMHSIFAARFTYENAPMRQRLDWAEKWCRNSKWAPLLDPSASPGAGELLPI